MCVLDGSLFCASVLVWKEPMRAWYPVEYRKLSYCQCSGIVNLLRCCGSAKVPVECGYLSEAFSQQTYQGFKSRVKCVFSSNAVQRAAHHWSWELSHQIRKAHIDGLGPPGGWSRGNTGFLHSMLQLLHLRKNHRKVPAWIDFEDFRSMLAARNQCQFFLMQVFHTREFWAMNVCAWWLFVLRECPCLKRTNESLVPCWVSGILERKVPVECGYLSEAFSQQTYQGCKSRVKCGVSSNAVQRAAHHWSWELSHQIRKAHIDGLGPPGGWSKGNTGFLHSMLQLLYLRKNHRKVPVWMDFEDFRSMLAARNQCRFFLMQVFHTREFWAMNVCAWWLFVLRECPCLKRSN